ncbi:ATPase, T2SS/T4P/T4SS family [Gottschalkiaceae bacterium SANA]|nr:ATPase, T2SS/T4P/T4SS family [Gottschalkiaceae bacterium SANA]
MSVHKLRLGDLLIENGIITDDQLKDALSTQKRNGGKLGETLQDLGFVTENEIINTLVYQQGIDYINLDKYKFDLEVVYFVPEKIARKYTVLALKKDGNQLTVTMEDPLNVFAIEDLHIISGYEIKVAISKKEKIMKYINQLYTNITAQSAIDEIVDEFSVEEVKQESLSTEDLANSIDNAPIVRLVNTVITQAVNLKASDIHIEPNASEVRVRVRVDGILREIMHPDLASLPAIVARIKIMSSMDIAERRIPQDGRIELVVNNKGIDLRVSTLPTVYGEKVVIRILDRSVSLRSVEELGLMEESVNSFHRLISGQNGIILVTGPTGSGKTTTLYAILNELNTASKNIVTLEDPVEYKLHGINQVQVHEKAGMTFAKGLRSILRQDPDTIMVGEIRDNETAEIAIKAAITGHLVLSTIHTNSALSTVTRLTDMGIPSYMVASSLKGIIAQRLVRRLCPHCKEAYESSEFEVRSLELDEPRTLYRKKGCFECGGTGYEGRTAVYEIFLLDEYARSLVYTGMQEDEMLNLLKRRGYLTLKDSCIELIKVGITSVDELNRVLGSM